MTRRSPAFLHRRSREVKAGSSSVDINDRSNVLKSLNLRVGLLRLTICNMAAVRHLEFSKFTHYVT